MEVDENNFSLIRFYEKRVRRIIPALFFVLAVCLPLSWFYLIPKQYEAFSFSLASVVGFVSNIYFYRTSGYFDIESEFKPLLHTWSLAVEEQYYFVFPIFILLFFRFGKRILLIALILVSILSFSLAEWTSRNHPSFAFFMLPTRGWELLVGSICSLLLRDNLVYLTNKIVGEVFSIVGILLIVYSVLFFNNLTPFPGLFALFPTLGTALVICFGHRTTAVGRLLGSKYLVGIGLISYSAYLWHQPLLVFVRERQASALDGFQILIIILATFVLAYLSWRYIEKPFRREANISRSAVFKVTGFGCFLLFGLGFAGVINSGFSERIPSISKMEVADFPAINNGYCFYSIDTNQNLKYGSDNLNCHLGDNSSSVKAVLFGDSYAGQYEPFWDEVGKRLNLDVHSITSNWCYPSLGDEYSAPIKSRAKEQCLFNRRYLIDNISRYEIIIVAGRWQDVLAKRRLDDVVKFISVVASKTSLIKTLEQSIREAC